MLAPLGGVSGNGNAIAQEPTTEQGRIVPALDEVIARYGDHEAKDGAEILYKYRKITLNEANE